MAALAPGYATGYTYDQILPVAAIAIGIAGSIAIGSHFAARSKDRAGG